MTENDMTDSNEKVVVIVVRSPDASNEIKVYGADDATVIDVDLGNADLRDLWEFLDWAQSYYYSADLLPADHPGKQQIYSIILSCGESHDYTSHEEIRAAIASPELA